MSGLIVNGRHGGCEADRYTYMHFGGPGIAFHAQQKPIDAGFAGYEDQINPSDLKVIPDPVGEGGSAHGFLDSASRVNYSVSLMYPYGYARYWTGPADKGHQSCYARFTDVFFARDEIYFNDELIYSSDPTTQVVLAVGVREIPDPDNPESQEKLQEVLYVTVPAVGYMDFGNRYTTVAIGYPVKCRAINTKTKEHRVLWTKSPEAVGFWGYSVASISPDGSKVATVIPAIGGPLPSQGIIVLNTEDGSINETRLSVAPSHTWVKSTTGTSTHHNELDVGTAWCGCCVPPDDATVMELWTSQIDYHKSSTTAHNYPDGEFFWACQYAEDGELLVVKATQKTTQTEAGSESYSGYAEWQMNNWSCRPDSSFRPDNVNIGHANSDSAASSSFSGSIALDLWGMEYPLYSANRVFAWATNVSGASESTDSGLQSYSLVQTHQYNEEYRQVWKAPMCIDLRAQFAVFNSMDETFLEAYHSTASYDGATSCPYNRFWDLYTQAAYRREVVRKKDVEIGASVTHPSGQNGVVTDFTDLGVPDFAGTIPTHPGGSFSGGTPGHYEDDGGSDLTVPDETGGESYFSLNPTSRYRVSSMFPTYPYVYNETPSFMGYRIRYTHCVLLGGVVVCGTPKWVGDELHYYDAAEPHPTQPSTYSPPTLPFIVDCYTVGNVGEHGTISSEDYTAGVNSEINIPLFLLDYVDSVRPV